MIHMETFSIGNVSANSGSKVYGHLRIGELHSEIPVNTWFIIINGAKDGPALLVTAGISGSGISSIEAARRISYLTDPKNLSGTLIVIPIVNEPAFLMRERSNVLENYASPIYLFGAFPGSSEASLTERIAHSVTKEFISRADYYVDLHNAAKGGEYESFVAIYPGITPTSLRPKVLEFARSFGTKFIVDAGSQGSIPPKLAGRPQVIAGSKGAPAIMSQCGEEGIFKEVDTEHQVKGVLNIMKSLSMLEGNPELPKEQLLVKKTLQIKSNNGGFLNLKVKLGEKVKKGQTMGKIANLFCEPIEQIKVPIDGYVTRVTTTLTICSGDRVGHISTAQPLS